MSLLWCLNVDEHGAHGVCPGLPGPEVMMTDEQWLARLRAEDDGRALEAVRQAREAMSMDNRVRIENWQGRIDQTADLQRMLYCISAWLDDSYPEGLDGEAHLRRRLDKVAAESGEMLDALADYVGENPRKGICGTREDVEYELLDVATAALGALMHMRGGYDVVGTLLGHVRHVYERAGLDWADLSPMERAERAKAMLASAQSALAEDMRKHARKIAMAEARVTLAEAAQ